MMVVVGRGWREEGRGWEGGMGGWMRGGGGADELSRFFVCFFWYLGERERVATRWNEENSINLVCFPISNCLLARKNVKKISKKISWWKNG